MKAASLSSADIGFSALLISALCLIALSMLFSISESSFLSINKLRLLSKINRRDKKALRAGRLLQKKEKMLNTLLVANELVNTLLSVILTAAALKLFGPAGVGIATFFATALLLVFGEITPKAISTRHPDVFAYNLSLFVQTVVKIFSPVVPIFTFVSRAVLKLFGVEIKKSSGSFTEEDIKTIIDVGKDAGLFGKSEQTMMHSVFKFTDLEAQSIMIPRTDIVAVPINASHRDILELSERTHFSRFPVYRNDIDDIVGILYIKDLLFYTGSQKDFSVQNIMRPPLFVPGTKNISYVQNQLAEKHQTIAVVIDEYSGTDGILTREDIVSEIFGIIKKDSPENRSSVDLSKLETSGEALLPGETRLIDLREGLHLPINSDINETLGGWITEKLGRLPESGRIRERSEFVDFAGFRFIVEKLHGRRIETVRVKKLSAAKENAPFAPSTASKARSENQKEKEK
ncbi:hemolysin family protein [Treponema parvum]|uniref:hemolysin family protein n=1 Tax=Treponema parvum TaxID=138851 RepID=UPI001AEBCB55|nr:hemolysin family protein [Treponema parvum]QTQ15258.1 HlyC/CorC family transporter [Treponema parvum]